jgi:hypothetical protein
MPNNVGVVFAALFSILKTWAYPVSLIAGLIFWFGVWYSRVDGLTTRMDRMEAKLDQLIMTLKK